MTQAPQTGRDSAAHTAQSDEESKECVSAERQLKKMKNSGQGDSMIELHKSPVVTEFLETPYYEVCKLETQLSHEEEAQRIMQENQSLSEQIQMWKAVEAIQSRATLGQN